MLKHTGYIRPKTPMNVFRQTLVSEVIVKFIKMFFQLDIFLIHEIPPYPRL